MMVRTRSFGRFHSLKPAALLAGAILLTGCAAEGWMQRSCVKQGFEPGTSGYDQCIAREKAWSDKLDRFGRDGGP